MGETIENLKNGNYSVIDKQGFSVTKHFVNCLEKEFAAIRTKLIESQNDYLLLEEQLENANNWSKLYKIALELACKDIRRMCVLSENYHCGTNREEDDDDTDRIKYNLFLKEAEEILKKENNRK